MQQASQDSSDRSGDDALLEGWPRGGWVLWCGEGEIAFMWGQMGGGGGRGKYGRAFCVCVGVESWGPPSVGSEEGRSELVRV